MIYIPKSVLKKLKLRREEDIKESKEIAEQAKAERNTKEFTKSLGVVDKIGKEIGEMRNWESYCGDPNLYMPFPIGIVNCNKQQLLQLLIHCYGTLEHVHKKKEECMDEILRLTLKEENKDE